ncbi:MAG: hypothetical protein MZU97_10770 [Bacillus subtilis]|nr:hypothetical protein [Bacillus subtilis]
MDKIGIYQHSQILNLSNNKKQANLNHYQANKTSSLAPLAKDTVSFTGLTRTLGKTIFDSPEEVISKMREYPNSKGVVGSVPKEWVDKIPFERRTQTIKEFYQDLKAAVNNFRDEDRKASYTLD